jgi:hypothetical protein
VVTGIEGHLERVTLVVSGLRQVTEEQIVLDPLDGYLWEAGEPGIVAGELEDDAARRLRAHTDHPTTAIPRPTSSNSSATPANT